MEILQREISGFVNMAYVRILANELHSSIVDYIKFISLIQIRIYRNIDVFNQ